MYGILGEIIFLDVLYELHHIFNYQFIGKYIVINDSIAPYKYELSIDKSIPSWSIWFHCIGNNSLSLFIKGLTPQNLTVENCMSVTQLFIWIFQMLVASWQRFRIFGKDDDITCIPRLNIKYSWRLMWNQIHQIIDENTSQVSKNLL